MSHSTSTANYSLPQFAGADKPAWLGDINPAMSAIDTQMKANADASATAGTNATSALNGIGTLANLTTTEKSNLVGATNEINTNLTTIGGVASGASTTATQAKNKADGLEAYLNLTQINSITPTTSNVTLSWSNVFQAVNADGSFGKIYGCFVATPTATSNASISFQTAFRPSETITMYGTFIKQQNVANANKTLFVGDCTINTSGVLTIPFASGEYNSEFRIVLLPCVIFAKSFADIPE